MSRCVVTRASDRCRNCLFPHRWCICDGVKTLETALTVHVLMHDMEALRPSSTGHLIKRALPASLQHIYRPERPLVKEDLLLPDRELWILHPLGEPVPKDKKASDVQVMLLDGNWRQASRMLRDVEPWGRKIALPLTGESRYWLREQQEGGRFSTVEALLGIFSEMGLQQEHEALKLQFELHVFAGLCLRGFRDDALRYLEASPLRDALPELVERLTVSKREIKRRAHAARAQREDEKTLS